MNQEKARWSVNAQIFREQIEKTPHSFLVTNSSTVCPCLFDYSEVAISSKRQKFGRYDSLSYNVLILCAFFFPVRIAVLY